MTVAAIEGQAILRFAHRAGRVRPMRGLRRIYARAAGAIWRLYAAAAQPAPVVDSMGSA
ncbi:hypothetical protein ACI2IY_12135 [Lysobacter enzymogenes]|uniref:hypothetical protein n=1 Tax=Lysobacter enzymogenes TaxID=69 RepID=UPI00384CE7ED